MTLLHFDTNALIALPLWARDGHPVVQRVLGGEAVAVSTIVWYEFLIGPLEPREAGLARAFIQGRIVEMNEADAELAAELFNTTGRQRTLKTDALIAAAAIRAAAELVTLNQADFLPFAEQGLRLFDGGRSL
ncbi:MAG TPA: PIN domain-containing protein [Pseudomonadales bacterium]